MQIFGLVAFIEQKENNIVFFLLDKGHGAKILQKECLFLLHYHFPMEDSSESLYANYIGPSVMTDANSEGRALDLPDLGPIFGPIPNAK